MLLHQRLKLLWNWKLWMKQYFTSLNTTYTLIFDEISWNDQEMLMWPFLLCKQKSWEGYGNIFASCLSIPSVLFRFLPILFVDWIEIINTSVDLMDCSQSLKTMCIKEMGGHLFLPFRDVWAWPLYFRISIVSGFSTLWSLLKCYHESAVIGTFLILRVQMT